MQHASGLRRRAAAAAWCIAHMSFNHYAKIKRILAHESPDWFIRRIDEPTRATNFKGEPVSFDHYYRIYRANGELIKYCKFQQIERLAQALQVPVEQLPVVDETRPSLS